MPSITFLTSVEALLKQGNATPHSYRPALKEVKNIVNDCGRVLVLTTTAKLRGNAKPLN